MYSSVNTPSEPCSIPPGVDRQAKSDRMSVSHKESSASSAQLEYTDTGQLGPANSTRVLYDRPNRDPQQTHRPPPIVTSLDNHALVTQEVQELIRKGAIVETTVSLNSFISQLFLVEKKGGGNDQSST